MTIWSELPLTEQHAAYLRDQAAITAEVAAAAGIRSAATVDDLPEWAKSWGEQAVPAIVFPWRSPSGEVVEQVRPDTPVVYDGEPHKYLWPRGAGAVLNTVRTDEQADTVLIVEGTKQAYAAASWAPAGVAIYGVGGCRNWSSDGVPLHDLSVAEDRHVVVLLDADVATNLDVYNAAASIGNAVQAEGALSVRYARLPASGTSGLDDVLSKRPQDKRAAYLERLITGAKTRPADSKPKPRKTSRSAAAMVVSPDRGMVYVDGDRLEVINQITRVLLERWDARRLFSHGEIISMLTGTEMRPLTKGVFLDLLQETTATVKRSGDEGETVVHTWPDGQTVEAVMSRSGWFSVLDRIARAPFVRPDGTVCQVSGYDETTGAMVVMDDRIAAINIPDSPTGSEVELARKLLMDDWLGDFPFHSEADRANALALVLTPFVRGQMEKVPLAVVDGLQMGVGKNLFADCVNLLATGQAAEPLPWTRDDEEVRKVITAAFRTGADIFVFDEAHNLDGAALARALTSATYKDRQLGVSQMLGFPNRVTWMSLGNQVRVEGDITRRVYRIALRPTAPDPHNRPSSSFRHPDLLDWTIQNRAELLTAALVLVRAWFTAGCPAPSRGVSFGSFEKWERIVGGIVENAGQPGFLDNLAEWRSETSFDLRYWNQHVAWLLEQFGSGVVFTCAQARSAMAADPHSEPPPGMTDLTENPRDYNRKLGVAYAKHADRYFDGIRLIRAEEMKHRGVAGWLVVAPTNGDGSGTDSAEPMPSGGSGGSGGSATPTHHEEKTSLSRVASPRDYSSAGTHVFTRTEAATSAPSAPSAPSENRQKADAPAEDGLAASEAPWDGVEQPSLFAETVTPVTEPPVHPTVDLATWSTEGEIELREGTVVFDIEGASAQLWPLRPDAIRITGVQQGKTIRIYSDAAEVADLLRSAKLIVGHNLMGFDLVAFALHHGVDIHELAAQGRLIDTMLTEVVVNPPEARTAQGQITKFLGLDALGAAKQLGGKTHDLGALAKEFGGYGEIPIDDERYVTYCAGDVNLTAKIGRGQSRTPYAIREHRVAAIAAQIRMNGFRVDRDLVTQLIAEGEALRAQRLGQLRDRYGLPLTKADGKPCKAPHATKEGKTAIARAFEDLGVELGQTKSGGPAFGKEAREELIERYADRPEVVELLETVGSLLGIRTVYATVERCLVGDRVHPDITMFQASGRWSITEPGLTVMGKRGVKYKEREIFLPEPGHVIIAADLSQVDARAVAAWCQDPAYLELFGPDRDSHEEIAVAVWGDKTRREDAKVLGHGWNYGMGIQKLAAKIGDEDTAREFDRAMKERYPELVAWKESVAARADAGEILDNGFGRQLRTTPGFGWTQGPALMGQSAARDVLMEGLLRMPRELYPYLRAVVHDEVVMSIPADRADEIEAQVIEAMSFPWAPREDFRKVNIEAGLGKRGANWGEVYSK